MSAERITQAELLQRLEAQGVSGPAHFAFCCPVCDTVQSAASLVRAGAGATVYDIEPYLGFSCVGRFTGAGEHNPEDPPGRGCNWSLGGLFRIHELEVDLPDRDEPRMSFRVATPEEARALEAEADLPDPVPPQTVRGKAVKG